MRRTRRCARCYARAVATPRCRRALFVAMLRRRARVPAAPACERESGRAMALLMFERESAITCRRVSACARAQCCPTLLRERGKRESRRVYAAQNAGTRYDAPCGAAACLRHEALHAAMLFERACYAAPCHVTAASCHTYRRRFDAVFLFFFFSPPLMMLPLPFTFATFAMAISPTMLVFD